MRTLFVLAAVAQLALAAEEAAHKHHHSPLLVTGAAGRTGSLVYRQLKAAGVEVRALVRNASKAKAALVFVGDVTAPETLGAAFSGVRRVAIAVGASPSMNATAQRAVEFAGVEHQVAALAAAGAAERVVLCSSMGTTEPSPDPKTGGAILFWKLNAEAALLSAGVPAVIVKPGGLTDGPGANATLVVGRDDALLYRELPTIARADVARVMVAALLGSPPDNLRFDVVAADGPPTTDLAALLESAAYPWERK
jgi:uncharacterized protein YbjT (DUF2867 family)